MIRQLFGLLLVACTLSGCKEWTRRNLTVELIDVDGVPITNATVTVLSSKRKYGGWCREDDCYHISAMTDSKGVASVNFWACSQYFDWCVNAPSHYDKSFRHKQPEGFSDDDLMRERECKSSRIVSSIHRKLVLHPKRNQQPMITNDLYDWSTASNVKEMAENTEVHTNGHSLVVFTPQCVDLETRYISASVYKSSWAASCRHADFTLERYLVETNGVSHSYGRMVFPPGCGAYVCKQTGDDAFPAAYKADTNAVYKSSFEYQRIVDIATRKVILNQPLIKADEYMVLRTRMTVAPSGTTNGWCYGELIGPMEIDRTMTINLSIFNPRLNDTNLEPNPNLSYKDMELNRLKHSIQ